MKAPFKGFINKSYPQGSCSQWFGENPALYSKFAGLVGHNGIDYVAKWGTPLYAVKDFEVIYKATNYDTGYGFELWLMHENEIWIYAHMSKTAVNVGDKITEGTYVGDMGNTGFVVSSVDGNGFWIRGSNVDSGTHLHIAKRLFHWYQEGKDTTYHGWYGGKRYVIENMNNGYNGWLDVRAELDQVSEIKTPQYIGGVNVEEARADLDKQGFTEVWQKIVYILKKYGSK